MSQWAGYQGSEVLGEKLVASAAHPNPRYPWMGRRGGLDGAELAHDMTSGAWRTKVYQVRREHLPDNPNWFAVSAFVERLHHEGELTDGPQ